MATKKTTTKKTTTTKTAPTIAKPVAAASKRAPARNTVAPKTVTATAPTYDEIARRAYLLFEARGFEHGHDVEDWQRAEAELNRGV